MSSKIHATCHPKHHFGCYSTQNNHFHKIYLVSLNHYNKSTMSLRIFRNRHTCQLPRIVCKVYLFGPALQFYEYCVKCHETISICENVLHVDLHALVPSIAILSMVKRWKRDTCFEQVYTNKFLKQGKLTNS